MKNSKFKKFLISVGTIAGAIISGLMLWKKWSKGKREKDADLKKDMYEDAGKPISDVEKTFYEKYLKRAIDIVLSLVGIVVLSPVFIVTAIAIYITDPGPVIFTQKRVGVNKTFFKLYKFRSMKMSTPHDVPTHMLDNPESYITSVGKFIRKTSIDELPQLFNILEGNLSVIGPRPALWNQEDLVKERDKYCANDVMPGLTGWAQINGRDELEIPVKAKLDGEYVDRLRKNSFSGIAMDIKCFLGTITSVLKSDGVVEGGTGELKKNARYDIEDVDTPIGFGEEVIIDFSKMKKVLITGANSYIGESFEQYAKEHYDENFQIDTVDMIDGSWREKDFSDYDTVFHVAGIAHADVGNISDEVKDKYYAVNTDLAIETAKKAKQDGVKQFVFMSSMIIYGDSAPFGKQKMITAETKPEPANFYGDSKWQADKGVRVLADETFHVLVLRPPMIYGKESKGNYPTLAKLAKKLPVFPDVNNQRSMLYIENLCEFLCQVMLVGKGGIFFPQNKEYTKTADMVKMISEAAGKKILITKLLNPFVWIGSKMPGKLGGLVNKAFGNSCYDKKISIYSQIKYNSFSLKDTIYRTEMVFAKNDGKKIAIVNCFDTYEHRVDLLYSYFKAANLKVRVYTSNFKHIEKCKRNDDKENYIYLKTIPYKKNISFNRLISHYFLSHKVFSEIEKEQFDIVWVLVPPNSFVKDAAKFKKGHQNVKLIFDIIDLWPETFPVDRVKDLPPVVIWKSIRDKYLCYADYVVTECDLFQQKILKYVDKTKLTTIYLAREIREYTLNKRWPDDKISLCYLGSINNIIDISTIISILNSIKRYRPVIIHIVGDGEKRDDFISLCKKNGVEVIYHGKVYDRDEKKEIFDTCHYGLNIMKDSVCVGLTMKGIDYFEAGLPIINNIHGDTWKYVEDRKLGINIKGDYDVLAKKIICYESEFRCNARLFFEEKLSVEEMYKKMNYIMNYIEER